MSRSKTFVVTGGLGFIGSHFVEKALEKGYSIINIDCETYAANKDLNFKGNYVHIKEDISQIKDLPHCHAIINFAAESHVDNSIEDSFNFVRTNVLGVYNLLEIIKNKNIKSVMSAWEYECPLFVQISTDEVFGDIEDGFFGESDKHTPSNPYSATKSAAEQLVSAWGRTYKIPYIITRTTNNYGPRQNSEKLIPRSITSILDGNKIPIHGSGTHIRNWIHVDDNVDAIFRIIEEGNRNESYHISSDEEYSVEEVVRIICKNMKVDYKDVTKNVMDRSGADVRYALDNSKVLNLGWKQTRFLDKEIENIISEYRRKTK
jgi:dTDP-glucose 4,6-dehydratase